jgi:type IV secretory pathway VirB2 component (pilin)
MMDYTDAWQHVVKHIMVLGGLVAAPLNIITCLLTGGLLLARKVQWRDVHPYIFVLNVIILLLQTELFIS